VASRSLPSAAPAAFAAALASLRAARIRPELRLTEVPPPARIAPHAVALTAEVIGGSDDDDDLASGRFVLLHDPACPEPWGGPWRIVTFARAELEPEMGIDPFLSEVGWSWLVESLESYAVEFTAEAGTVTTVVSESFGGLRERARVVELEVRASWTPTDGDPAAHLEAWSDLLCTIAGLPPLPEGVVALPGRRR
jgi:hypothetical protein